MSTHIPLSAGNPKLALKSHFGIDATDTRPRRAINKGPFGLPTGTTASDSSIPPPVLPSMMVATVSAKELAEIKNMSQVDRAAEQRAAFLEEKQRLHIESSEKSKQWPGTIVGERIKNLARKSEREADLEIEKIKIDSDWHKIVAQERVAKIQKARAMQMAAADPQMRELHSKLTLSNVLYVSKEIDFFPIERDRQVQHKKKMEAILKEHAFDESVLLERAKRENAMELVKQEMARREARRVAQEYPLVIKQKQEAKKKQREEDKAFQNEIIKASKQELEEEKEAEMHWKQAGYQDVEEVYTKALQLKQQKKEQEETAEQQMRVEHQLYNEYTDAIAKNRVQVLTKKRQDKSRTYDLVAEVNRVLAAESAARLDKAVAVMQNAHKDRALNREISDKERKTFLELDARKGRSQQIAAIQEESRRDKQEGIDARTVLDKDFQAFQQLTAEEQKAKVNSLRNHYHGLAEQIAVNKVRRGREEELNRKRDIDLIPNFDAELTAYQALLEEFCAEGKNVTTAVNILHPRQPFPPVQFETRFNTFARLGFI
ncbi:hypothetical protein HDU98_002734 [Podochytrium sp. JEL0797]|nr:hypothetical protein HDU98_002734 [Podochytrium sp. JEL0797]